MRTSALIAAAAWLALPAAARADGARPLPRFEDYPATARLAGPPKPPVLGSPMDRRYRTRLRQGVLFGEGLAGVASPARPPEPNFAGAFYAITWGCGSDGCTSLALVDGRTGAVYGPPPGAPNNDFIATPRTSECPGIGLRPDSRLLFIDYTSYESGQPVCERTYYEWRGLRYRLVRKAAVIPSAGNR